MEALNTQSLDALERASSNSARDDQHEKEADAAAGSSRTCDGDEPRQRGILVRHGQYDLEGEERGLTDLGRRQSEKLAQRLSAERQLTKKDRYGEVRIQYAGIWVSNVTRAIQTAQTLICKKTMTHDDEWQLAFSLLPATPEAHREEKETPKEVKEPKEPEHVYEIYVCHMNLIRYFVMRALQLPPEAWLRLRGDNTNITEIVVHADGRVSLHRFGDIGHLPLDMVTFH
eukprot:g22477.t1